MKKTIIALAAMACPLVAQEAAPAAPSVPAVVDAAAHESQAREVLACVKDICETLQAVKDRETADAAAPKVKGQAAAFALLLEKVEAMPAEVSAADTDVDAALEGLLGQVRELEELSCHESEALSDAVQALLVIMPDSPGDGAEEVSDDPAPYIAVFTSFVDCVREFCELMEGVQDQATAEAALPAARSIKERMAALGEKARSLPEPTLSVQLVLQESLEPLGSLLVQKYGSTCTRLTECGCYGCGELADFLDDVMEITRMGDAGMEN